MQVKDRIDKYGRLHREASSDNDASSNEDWVLEMWEDEDVDGDKWVTARITITANTPEDLAALLIEVGEGLITTTTAQGKISLTTPKK